MVLSASSNALVGTPSVSSSLTPGPQGMLSPENGSADVFSYTPQQIRTAYGVSGISFGGTPGDGTGQTIAIIDAYDEPDFVDSTAPDFSSSDLAKFDKAFGLPDPPSFTKYNQFGQTTNLPGTGPNSPGPNSYQIEEALDVEWAHAIAPGASIDLIECNSGSSNDLYTGAMTAAGLPGVSVVSMSFTAPEWSGETAYDADFTTPEGHQGVTFLASTGDYGSPAGYPALSPNVVAVGGTSLFLNPDNSYNDETGWTTGSDSFDPTGAGAGGVSAYEPVPAYQTVVDPSTHPLSGRAAPDVSMDADPATGVAVYDSYNNGSATPWVGEAGTSLSAPMFAGLIAIANQGRVLQGGTTLNSPSDPTQTLSALYSLPPTDFHSITTGNNGGYNAGPGYNEVTGLGSPVANLLVPDLAAYGMASQLVVTAQPPPVVAVGQPFDVQISAEDSFGNVDYSYDSDVTLSGPVLNGSSVTVPAIEGVATFTGVSVNAGGSDLRGSGANLTAAVTNVIYTDGGVPLGYTPQQIRSAYGIDQITFGSTPGTGTGETIAIIDPYDDPDIRGDVAAFDQLYDLPTINLTVVNQQGVSSPLPAPDPTGDSEFEEALDVEWTHAIAPGARIVLVECNSNADSDLFAAASTAAALSGVSVVLMSLSGNEFSSETSFDNLFTSPSGHQGVTFVTSAGQDGTLTYPAGSPNVLAVGGTSLFLNAGNSYDGETAWTSTNGGPSQYEAEPSYQEGVQSTGQRTIPDVAFDADTNTGVTIYNSYDNASAPLHIDGFTDFAAAAWAGLIAIANQGRVSEGGSTLNSGNTGTSPQQTQTALYSLPYTDYHDVTTGSNGSSSAGPGYDAVTGLGTPIANLLVPDLAAYGMATQLGFTQQPFHTLTAGDPFTLIVSAEDADGRVDSSYDGSVTLTLPSGSGTATATAMNGVARFTFLKVNSPGSGDTIRATASGLAGATSNLFNVQPPGATSTITALASSLNPSTYSHAVIFTATVNDTSGGVPTGRVEFYDGSIDLGPGTVLSGSGNSATSRFTTSTLAAGSQSIFAVYIPTGVFGASTGMLTQTVHQAVLTVLGITAADKVYNASTLATLNTSGATLAGVVSGDVVALNTDGAFGTFASQNVGTGISVTLGGLTIAGAQAGDYTLTQPTTTANITAAPLTVSGITAANKVYNASTAATLNTSSAALVGVFSGDLVDLNTAAATGSFASQNVGTGITVTVGGLTIGGAQAGDYTLTQPATTANITPVTLSVLGITAASKVYDASTLATINTSGAMLMGVVSGDTVNLNTSAATGSFATQNVGTGITVTVAGLTIAGAQAGDYTLTQPATAASITPASLTVSGITAANHAYDASTAATLDTSGATLVGVFSGDTVSLDAAGATGTFASQNVGTGITVTVTGLTLDGPEAGDYTLTQPATAASITPAMLSVSGITAASKVYDASTTATLNTSSATLEGVFSGDLVALNTAGATGTFAAQSVGTGITVRVAGLTIGGAQAANYTLSQPTTTASITPVGLTVSGITAANKVYNANTTATVNTSAATLVGVLSGDIVNLNKDGATGTFASQHAGTGVTVTVTGLTIGGAQAGDYTLAEPTTTASITQATPMVSLSVSGGTYNGSAFNASASVTGVGGQASAELEGIAATPVYYAGSTVSSVPLSAAPIDAGTYTVVANFPGTADYLAASSAPATFTVAKAMPAISVVDPGGFYDGSAFSAAAPLTGAAGHAASELEGVAATSVYHAGNNASGTPLAGAPIDAGTYTVVANFPGTADYLAASSAPVTFTIARAIPTVALATSGNSAVFGQAVALVANVAAPGGGLATGTVTFSSGGTILGTIALGGSGAATLASSALAVGAQSITATYSGDTNFQGRNSAAASVAVTRDGTEIVLIPQPMFKKKKLVSVRLEAVIKPLEPGGGVANGLVTFEVQSKKKKKVIEHVLGTAVLDGASATLTLKPTAVLKKTITVLYGGDADFTSSTLTPRALTQQALKSLARPAMFRPLLTPSPALPQRPNQTAARPI